MVANVYSYPRVQKQKKDSFCWTVICHFDYYPASFPHLGKKNSGEKLISYVFISALLSQELSCKYHRPYNQYIIEMMVGSFSQC